MWPHLVRRLARPEAVESLRSRFYSVPQPPVGDHQAAWLSSWSIALATNAPTTLRSIYWRQKKTFGYWHSHDRWKLAYVSVALTHAPQWVAAVTFVCLYSKTGITKAFFDGIWRPPVLCSDMWTFTHHMPSWYVPPLTGMCIWSQIHPSRNTNSGWRHQVMHREMTALSTLQAFTLAEQWSSQLSRWTESLLGAWSATAFWPLIV